MATKKIADRVKTGPHLSSWVTIAKKYKELKDYKPDVSDSVKDYDDDLKKAADITKSHRELAGSLMDIWSKSAGTSTQKTIMRT